MPEFELNSNIFLISACINPILHPIVKEMLFSGVITAKHI